MSRHDTLTLAEHENNNKKGRTRDFEAQVDGIINMFNQYTHTGNVEGSGENYRVFNRSVDIIRRNNCYDIILNFLLLMGEDDSFPTIRREVKCLFIRPTILLNSPFDSPKRSIIPSFYALEFTLHCMGWVYNQHSEEMLNRLKVALDGLDNSHSITTASVCELFYYTDDKSPYPIVDKILVLCEQIQSSLNDVGIGKLFTTFSINRLLSTYMMYIIKLPHKSSQDYYWRWNSPSDFAHIEDCSPMVAYIDEPVKRYNFFKDKYNDIKYKYIQDILQIIRPVSLLSQHASRTPDTKVYSSRILTSKQLKEERIQRRKILGITSSSRRGGNKYCSRCHRHPASATKRTKRHTRRRRRRH